MLGEIGLTDGVPALGWGAGGGIAMRGISPHTRMTHARLSPWWCCSTWGSLTWVPLWVILRRGKARVTAWLRSPSRGKVSIPARTHALLSLLTILLILVLLGI